MNRRSYFVIPKGDGTAGTITNMIAGGKGRLTRLNSYELNSLTNNPEFDKQFEVVDADFYKDYAKAALTASGKKKIYQTGSTDQPLLLDGVRLSDGSVVSRLRTTLSLLRLFCSQFRLLVSRFLSYLVSTWKR